MTRAYSDKLVDASLGASSRLCHGLKLIVDQKKGLARWSGHWQGVVSQHG